jgi:hypothetical protein
VTANPTNLSFLGIAKETTKGTAAAATDFIPVKSIDPSDTIMYFEDTGMRGAMVDIYNEVAGPASASFDLAGDVFPDTIGYPIAGIMGDVSTSGIGPFTHAIGVKNSGDGQPVSYSLTDFYGLSGGTPARRQPGCQFTDLSLKWQGDGMFEWTAKTLGFQSAQVAKPTASFSTVTPLPAYLGTLTIGGSSKLFMESGQMNLKRAGTPIHTVDGTQAPYQIWVGPLGVSGKLTFVHEDDTELQRMLQSTQAAIVLSWTSGTNVVQVTMTKPQYKTADVKRGKDYITTEIEYVAVANTTDVGASGGYGQVKFSITNSKPSGTYA